MSDEADAAFEAAIARQNAFDERLAQIRAEGADAFARGLPKSSCPYSGSPEPHHALTWVGGWAEAALDAMFPT